MEMFMTGDPQPPGYENENQRKTGGSNVESGKMQT